MYTEQRIDFYKDGELTSSRTFLSEEVEFNTMAVGGDMQGNPFKGKLDEVRVWSISRTPAQIQEAMMVEVLTEPNLEAVFPEGGKRNVVTGANGFRTGNCPESEEGILPGESTPAQEALARTIRAAAPVLRLNQCVYADGDVLNAVVRFVDTTQPGLALPAIGIFSPGTKDLEALTLQPGNDPLIYTTDSVSLSVDGGDPVQGDGVFEALPGESIIAFLNYEISADTVFDGDEMLALTSAVVAGADVSAVPQLVNPALALTDDEVDQGSTQYASFAMRGGVSVGQVAMGEVLFRPDNQAELARFIQETGGTVLASQDNWFRVRLTPDPTASTRLPDLRKLFELNGELQSSRAEALDLYATVLELWMMGYRVTMHPRALPHSPVAYRETEGVNIMENGSTRSGSSFPGDNARDERLAVRQGWAFMGLHDFDQRRVPVGIIDVGFAPNPDFRGFQEGTMVERDVGRGLFGPGAASAPADGILGESKAWHGNGVVSVAGGKLGNRFGSAGVAGQVMDPMLYRMGLSSLVFDMGSSIRAAVNDGASVINISAGFPCRLAWRFGPDEICTRSGRAAFTAKLAYALAVLAYEDCRDRLDLPVFVEKVICGVGAAVSFAVGAAFSPVILAGLTALPDARGPLEAAVAFSLDRGVPIVASAGNRIRPESLPVDDLIDENFDVGAWQVIPAVIPGVICVGAVQTAGAQYRSSQLHGNRVDIFAPEVSFYYRPTQAVVEVSTLLPSDHVRDSFNGTSSSAPFVTGTIANMMAINPGLDRRGAPVGGRTVVNTVRNILLDAAYIPTEDPASWLPSTTTRTNDTNLVRDLVVRTNLINPLGMYERAYALTGHPDVASLGYNTNDYGRTDEDISPFSVGPSSTDVMYREVLGPNDTDLFELIIAGVGASTTYRIPIEVRIPTPIASLGDRSTDLRLLNLEDPVITIVGGETVFQTYTKPAFSSTFLQIGLSTVSGMDSLYQITIGALEFFESVDPDAFEGTIPDLGSDPNGPQWREVPKSGFESQAYELRHTNLNFHTAMDQDTMTLVLGNENWEPESCQGDCQPALEISATDPSVELIVVGSDGVRKTVAGGRTLELNCIDYLNQFPLYIVASGTLNQPVEYDVVFRWAIRPVAFCEKASEIRDIYSVHPAEFDEVQRAFDLRFGNLNGSRTLGPMDLDPRGPVISPDYDEFGRSQDPRLFRVEVINPGPLRVRGRFDARSDLTIGLFDVGDAVGPQPLGEASSLADLFAQRSGTSVRGVAGPVNPDPELGPTELEIFVPFLEAGKYLLAISDYRLGDSVTILLSENATPPGGVSLEDVEAGELVPAPPIAELEAATELVELLESPAPPILSIQPLLAYSFNAAAGQFYQAQVFDPDGFWTSVGPLVFGQGQSLSLQVPLDGFGQPARIQEVGGAEPPAQVSTDFGLQFPTFPGRMYRLEATESLNGSWLPMENVEGDGEPYLGPSISEALENQKFFRVQEMNRP